ncbi:MAG: hypothetical protein ACJ72X_15205, partial [Nitrososphaeraceae archaeon]
YSNSKLKYGKQVLKRPKMTCIIGGKCSDGVVLIADRKSVDLDTGLCDSDVDKLFIFHKDSFYYPIVIGSAGRAELDKKFKDEALDTLRRMSSMQATHNFKVQGPSDTDFNAMISGTIYPYSNMSENNTGKEVILTPYISKLEDIVKKYKREYSSQPFDVLFAAQIQYKGAVLFYIPRDGVSDKIDKFKVIGSGEIPANVFLKSTDPSNMTMEQFAKWGYFIIKYIEEKGIDNYVGVGQYKPQIYFIPNQGHLGQAQAQFLDKCEASKKIMQENLEALLPA